MFLSHCFPCTDCCIFASCMVKIVLILPYLEQHDIIDIFCCIIARMSKTFLNLADLPVVLFFLLFLYGVHPKKHLLIAAGNRVLLASLRYSESTRL